MATETIYMRVPFRAIATAERRVTYIQGDVIRWLSEQPQEWRDTHELGAATTVTEQEYRRFLEAIATPK